MRQDGTREKQRRSSIYTDAQWRWAADRHREGYTLVELGEFLGVHRNTVKSNLIRLGAIPANTSSLPPLSERMEEFAAIST